MEAIDDVVLSSFDQLLDHLREGSWISPERFAALLAIDLQTLAAQAQVHRNTIRRAPGSASVQAYLRQALRVLRAGYDTSEDMLHTLFWFKNTPIPTFDYQAPSDLVGAGRTDDLLRYLQSCRRGLRDDPERARYGELSRA